MTTNSIITYQISTSNVISNMDQYGSIWTVMYAKQALEHLAWYITESSLLPTANNLILWNTSFHSHFCSTKEQIPHHRLPPVGEQNRQSNSMKFQNLHVTEK